ncbi:hypothetical protein ABW19_dt0209313 [Dactylella cylindrospora]|nr:hypothetical protein ABW19_dt0209313 [Dactylella cylindrospora]
MRRNSDIGIQRKGRLDLRCLDDFEWRIGRAVHSSKDTEFWTLLDQWERSLVLRHFRNYEKRLWWSKLRGIEPCGQITIRLLQNIERCLWDPSGITKAMQSFARDFKTNLLKFMHFNEMHLLLNRLDRVIAIVVSSSIQYVSPT